MLNIFQRRYGKIKNQKEISILIDQWGIQNPIKELRVKRLFHRELFSLKAPT